MELQQNSKTDISDSLTINGLSFDVEWILLSIEQLHRFSSRDYDLADRWLFAACKYIIQNGKPHYLSLENYSPTETNSNNRNVSLKIKAALRDLFQWINLLVKWNNFSDKTKLAKASARASYICCL